MIINYFYLRIPLPPLKHIWIRADWFMFIKRPVTLIVFEVEQINVSHSNHTYGCIIRTHSGHSDTNKTTRLYNLETLF